MSAATAVRSGINGLIVIAGVAISAPVIVAAERVRRGAGRSVASLTTRAVSRLCGIRFEVHGRDQLDDAASYVFVPNHSSPADVPAMLVTVPDVGFLAAAELFRIPLLRSAMRAMGTTPVDRARPSAAHRQLATGTGVAATGSVVVFAEGGIPPEGERVRFKSGAFVLAIQTRRAVVPVSISGSDAVLPRGRWIWARPGVIAVQLHEPIDTRHLTLADRKALRDLTELAVRSTEWMT